METGDNERTRRVTILLTPAEYAEVKRRAGLVALGVWIRHTVLSADALPLHEWRAASNLEMNLPSPKFPDVAGTREPGRKVHEGDEATSKGAAAQDGVGAVQRGKRAKGRPRDHRAQGAAQHGEKSNQDHVAGADEPLSLCEHGFIKWMCPKWGCPNYKYAR